MDFASASGPGVGYVKVTQNAMQPLLCSLWKPLWQEATVPQGRPLMPAVGGAEKQLGVPVQGARSRRGFPERSSDGAWQLCRVELGPGVLPALSATLLPQLCVAAAPSVRGGYVENRGLVGILSWKTA